MNNHFSGPVKVFHGMTLPVEAIPAGYAAMCKTIVCQQEVGVNFKNTLDFPFCDGLHTIGRRVACKQIQMSINA